MIFLGVYVASYTAGLLTNMPGGIGVFDTAMLLGLRPYLDAPRIVGAIVVFRLCYYVIPLFLAGSLFAGNEILLRGGMLWQRAATVPAMQTSPAGASRTSPSPAAPARWRCAACCCCAWACWRRRPTSPGSIRTSPAWPIQAGQFVPSLIGAGLVMMAIGLSHRVNLAWGLTLVLLMAGAAFTATQGDRLWVASICC